MSGGKRQAKLARRQQANAIKALTKIPADAASKSTGDVGAGPSIEIDQLLFRWSIQRADFEVADKWHWKMAPHDVRHMMEALEDASGKTWGQLKTETVRHESTTRQKHHAQAVSSLCVAARKRLGEIQILEDELFRLHLGQLPRLWGYVERGVFYILWFDRGHNVYPLSD